ncbi:MAG: hypothetical protein U0531_20990 [Dehalococcoidia bacterium]
MAARLPAMTVDIAALALPEGHSYSNIRVLLAELAERGWLPAGVHEEQPAVSE